MLPGWSDGPGDVDRGRLHADLIGGGKVRGRAVVTALRSILDFGGGHNGRAHESGRDEVEGVHVED